MRLLPFLLIALLASCGPEPNRVLMEPVTSTQKVRASVKTVAVMEVSLPAYAEEDEVRVQVDEGGVADLPEGIWADAPERALTNALVRNLVEITGARVAADPWPLAGYPDAEVTVRVERMLTLNSGVLEFAGQYAIRYDAPGRSGKVKLFRIAVPVTDLGGAQIAAAHGAAWVQLSEKIARDL